MQAPPWLARALRVFFGIAGIAFMAVAFAQTWDEADRVLLPSWPRVTLTLVLLIVGLNLAGMAWAALLGRPFSTRSLVTFVLAQLGKYIPGAVWQAVGQIDQAVRAQVAPRKAAVAFIIFTLTQVATGGLLGSTFAVVGAESRGVVRVASLFGLLLLVTVQRRVLFPLVAWLGKRRGLGGEDLLPTPRAFRRGLFLNLGTVTVVCLAFAVVLEGMEGTPLLEAAAAFALAWTAGLLVVPIPAGLGIREAVLIAAMGHAAAPASLIAASVFVRLGFLLSEILVILVGSMLSTAKATGRGPARILGPEKGNESAGNDKRGDY